MNEAITNSKRNLAFLGTLLLSTLLSTHAFAETFTGPIGLLQVPLGLPKGKAQCVYFQVKDASKKPTAFFGLDPNRAGFKDALALLISAKISGREVRVYEDADAKSAIEKNTGPARPDCTISKDGNGNVNASFVNFVELTE